MTETSHGVDDAATPEDAATISRRSRAGQRPRRDPGAVAAAATLAALLEAAAEKPGNVTPSHAFADMTFEDLARSAVALGPVLAGAGERGVGASVLAGVQATRAVTAANTNLGIVLLFAPLARAELAPSAAGATLRERVALVLAALDREDARAAYAAIRLAAPGGLGAADEQDVAGEPAVGLREAMALAAGRDAIAAEYASEFRTTFDVAVPALGDALDAGLDPRAAAVETHLMVLAAAPDTLIARKRGLAAATAVAARAGEVLAAGGVRSPAGRAALGAFDAELRGPDHTLNPGTTADLVAAALFVAFLEGLL